MRYFSVVEALQYLNKMAPGSAPKNEETLRRAIRSGELKAEINRGREGSKIAETDLVAYGRRYISRQKGNTMLYKTDEAQISGLMLPKTTAEILKNAVLQNESPGMIKIEFLENKRKWAERAASLRVKLQEIENEINMCESEIEAMEYELSQLKKE